MANGNKHDNSVGAFAVCFLWIGIFTSFYIFFLGLGFACCLLINPDLDLSEKQWAKKRLSVNALKRWGVLGIIWLPYGLLIKHRSFWSHGFLIGSSIRVLYLSGLYALVSPYTALPGIIAIYLSPYFWALFTGIVLGDLVHLWLDGGKTTKRKHFKLF